MRYIKTYRKHIFALLMLVSIVTVWDIWMLKNPDDKILKIGKEIQLIQKDLTALQQEMVSKDDPRLQELERRLQSVAERLRAHQMN